MPPGYAVVRPNIRLATESGLVAAWDFGDPVNTTLMDISSIGPYNATLVGGPVIAQTPIGNCMQTDGATQYATCASINGNFASGNCSFEAWVNFNSLALTGAAASRLFSSNEGGAFSLAVDNNGAILVYLYTGAWRMAATGNGVVSTLRWHHIVLTYDGLSSTPTFYVNGEVIAPTANTLAGAFGPIAGALFMDVRSSLAGGWLNGYRGPSRIYNKVLSQSGIRSHIQLAKTAQWRTKYEDISVSSADEGGVVGNYLGMPSGSPTPFQFGETVGRWRIVTDTVNGTQNCKIISNVTAVGRLYLQTSILQQNTTEAAFGAWEFWINKNNGAADMFWLIIASSTAGRLAAAQNGYLLSFASNEKMYFARITGGAITNLMNTPVKSLGTWYKFRITRTTAGVFSLYVDDQLAAVEAGSNPVTDINHITSLYTGIEQETSAGNGYTAYSCSSGDKCISKGVT